MRLTAPRIFVSYAPNKSLNAKAVTDYVTVVKDRLRVRDWEIIDPMVSVGIDQISKKVHDALYMSDALIAECTTVAPNVMYEIGAIRGLGRTVILGVDPGMVASSPEKEQLRSLYGLSDAKPVATDLGDVEYLRYHDLSTQDNRAELESKLDDLLTKIEKTVLKAGSRHLQRQFYSFVPIVQGFCRSIATRPSLTSVRCWMACRNSRELSKAHRQCV